MKSYGKNIKARFISILLTVLLVLSGFSEIIGPGRVEAAGTTISVNVTVMYDYAYQVLDKINAERSKNGLASLQMDATLLDGAIQRATESVVIGAAYEHSEIDSSLAHSRPDGSSCFTVNNKVEGENIAYGQKTPSIVVEQWMGSTGHRENILTAAWKSVGIGVVYVNGNYYYYWAQAFSSSPANVPASRNDEVKKTIAVNVSTDVYNRLSSKGAFANGFISNTSDGGSTSKNPSSGGWTQVGNKWKYKLKGKYIKKCWLKIDNDWYAFGSDGFMYTGWKTIKKKKYYFSSSGVMASNEWVKGKWVGSDGVQKYKPKGSWHHNSTGWWFGDTTGWYVTGAWQKIDGKWYYFNSSGYMLTNTYVDGYYVGADGAML